MNRLRMHEPKRLRTLELEELTVLQLLKALIVLTSFRILMAGIYKRRSVY